MKPKAVLADDHPAILQKVSEIVSRNFEVVECVGDGAAAVSAVERLKPEIIVMDVSMPAVDGFKATRQIRRLGTTKVILLTVHNDPDYVSCAIESGAHGYVLKSHMKTDLLLALQEVLAGRTFVLSAHHSNKSAAAGT